MSVNEKQTFVLALNGGMVGKYFPTQLDDDVMDPLKDVLKKDLDELFRATPQGPSAPAPLSAHPPKPAPSSGGF
jgi:hypothetical protein